MLLSVLLILSIGPSPPRSIYLRLSYNSEVCATWRTPATTNGALALYKLYAETIDTSSDIIDAVDLPTTAVVKVCILCMYRRIYYAHCMLM